MLRLSASSMAMVLIASSVLATGCGKNKDLIVQADSPWYDLQKVTIGEQYKNDETVASFDMYFIGRTEEFLLFSTFGNYKNRQSSDNYLEDFFANSFQYIDVYDLDGKLINSIDQLRFMKDENILDMDSENTLMGWGLYTIDDNIALEYDGIRYLIDPSIVAIVREEIPSYFCGQKTLDEVISIVEDRTQTLLDERS